MQIHLDELNSVQTIYIINNSKMYYRNLYWGLFFFKSKLTNGIKYFLFNYWMFSNLFPTQSSGRDLKLEKAYAMITILTLPERFPVSGQHQGLSVISWNVAQGSSHQLWGSFLDDIRFRTFQCYAAAGNNNLFLV